MSARLPSRDIKQARPLDSGKMQRQAVRRVTRGLVEGVSALLLTGQVGGRWSRDLGIWGWVILKA